MSISDYKESIKKIIDATDNESLLKGWKMQLEHDLKPESEINFTDHEWSLIKEGLDNYEKNETISFEEFISKRR